MTLNVALPIIFIWLFLSSVALAYILIRIYDVYIFSQMMEKAMKSRLYTLTETLDKRYGFKQDIDLLFREKEAVIKHICALEDYMGVEVKQVKESLTYVKRNQSTNANSLGL